MLYPFIYTRTKYHDYRAVTSESTVDLPQAIVRMFTNVARTMIDADDTKLEEPSWVLVKENGYTLWGMSVLNKHLGTPSQDKVKRPVRGFFGFISDDHLDRLPYDISYFIEIYKIYVIPIWESYDQIEQIKRPLPLVSEYKCITPSLRQGVEINLDRGICRVFPSGTDCTSLIESVLASSTDCTIATNIHKEKQFIEFSKDKLSFMNVVGASDLNISSQKDITVSAKTDSTSLDLSEQDDNPSNNNFTGESGEHGNDNNDDNVIIHQGSDSRRLINRYLKNGLCVLLAVIGLLFVVDGSNIWDMILSPKQQEDVIIPDESGGDKVYETSSVLTTNKRELQISDAAVDDIFSISYQSSSILKEVYSSEEWILIATSAQQYSTSGVIQFSCTPTTGSRTGYIHIVNVDGKTLIIPIYQSVSNNQNANVDIRENTDNKRTIHSVAQQILSVDKTFADQSSNIVVETPEAGAFTEGTN